MHATPRLAACALGLAAALLMVSCTLLPTSPAPGLPLVEPAPALSGLAASELLARGASARTLGDYDGAAAAFEALLAEHPQARQAAAARYYLAETYVARQRWASAARALEAALAAGLDPTLQARALFMLGSAYEASGQQARAIAAYAAYRSVGGPLEAYAVKRQATLQEVAGALEPAAEGFAHAASSEIARGERAVSYEAAIRVNRQLGRNQEALRLYRELLAYAEVPAYRARILGEGAALAEQLGDAALARSWRTEILTRTPELEQAPLALAALEAEDQAGIDPAIAARVLAAHARASEALARFDTALTAELPPDERLALRRERALALRATGDLAGAAAELAAIGEESPASPAGRQALFDRAETNVEGGNLPLAAELYEQYAARYPDDEATPVALARAAELLEEQGDTERAARARDALVERYPASEAGQRALAARAATLEAAGDLAGARDVWVLRGDAVEGAARAESYFYAAAARRGQEPEAASELWRRAAAAAPRTYWGVRAAELAGLPFEGAAVLGGPPEAADWVSVEVWLDNWSGETLSTTLAARADPALDRAAELRMVGLSEEAALEWQGARERYREQPRALYALARAATEAGDTYAALLAASALEALAQERAAPPTPPTLRRVAFPTPYAALVREEASAQGIDPLLLYAMMRQESLFNPSATSWVGARGLTQVMPETGAGIAQRLDVSPFRPDDLYQPPLSIRFGAFYLAAQIDALEGDGRVHGGLAAYNGGPGNAQRWAGGSNIPDPEAFVAAIDFAETKDYVMSVYAFYGTYRQIYQSAKDS